MKVLQVSNISFIEKDKDGKVLNLFVLRLSNGLPNVLRKQKEFLIDLKESGMLPLNFDISHPRAISHPDFVDALRDLKAMPFTIRGVIDHHKKGELWTVTENSSVVKDKNHPEYGKYAVGSTKPYDNDCTIVTEGFLTITPNLQIIQMNKTARAEASMKAFSSGFDVVEEAPQTKVDEGYYGSSEPADEQASAKALEQALGTKAKATAKAN